MHADRQRESTRVHASRALPSLRLRLSAFIGGSTSSAVDAWPLPACDSKPLRRHGRCWPLFRGDARAHGVAGVDACPTMPAGRSGRNRSARTPRSKSTAAIVDGVIYIGSLTTATSGALDLADGEEKWKFHSELGFSSAAGVRDGRVYVGDVDGVSTASTPPTASRSGRFDDRRRDQRRRELLQRQSPRSARKTARSTA